MRKSVLWVCMAALCLTLLSVPALAQNDMNRMGPPKVLMIIREEVKPGKAVAHEQHEAAWTQAFLKAKYTTPALGLTSVTGNAEAWFLVGFDSFAAMEKDSERMEKDAAIHSVNTTFGPKESEFLEGSRTMTARFRPELSYKPGVNIGEYKYFQITVIRFRLGESAEDFYKALNGAREKAGLDSHIAIYQVNSGMPTGTFISFVPVKSLEAWDAPPNTAMDAALKEINFSQMAGKAVVNVESRLYSFAPQLSIVSDQMAQANPNFWRPKPAMGRKAAASGEVTPATKKDTNAPDKK